MDAFDTAVANGLNGVKLSADAAELPGISAQLAETAAHYDRSGAFPHENFQLLHQHGLIGLVAARELAGEPLTLPEARQVIEAVARGEPSTALVLIMTYLFVFQAARNPNWNSPAGKLDRASTNCRRKYSGRPRRHKGVCHGI